MRFSIIIPVYNAEKYLRDCVESVINQSINFKENVEIILVDDGSTDKSNIICQSYKKTFPNNVKYIYIENSGPSIARNTGLDAVSKTTQFIGFLDADDYLSNNTLEKVGNFFSQNPTIQLAVIPLYHFERIDTPHKLNYRFEKGDRVINILEEYKNIHFHIGGCFFSANQFIDNPKNRFRTDIRFWEDALFINSFLLENQQYGVVSEPKYYYRKRVEENSLVSGSWYQKSRYSEMIHSCYIQLINESKRRYDEIIPYIQFLIIYHLKLYLFPKNNPIIYEVLTTSEQEEFFKEFVHLIQMFDEKYIKEQDMPFYYKNYLLTLGKNGWPYTTDTPKFEKQKVKITKCKLKGLKWEIEGNFMNKEYFMKASDRLFIIHSNNIIYLPKVNIPGKVRIIWGTVVRNYEHAGFKVSLPCNLYKLQFGLETDGGKRYLLNKVGLMDLLRRTFSKR